MAKTRQTDLATAIRRSIRYGDFLVVTDKKTKLTECPLCALDPDRERHAFEAGARRDVHFETEHNADDIGRPLAELLPGGPS